MGPGWKNLLTPWVDYGTHRIVDNDMGDRRMPQFNFKSTATETLHGTAYFSVEAETEEEARKLLAEDSSEYFTDFNEEHGGVEWDATEAKDFEEI